MEYLAVILIAGYLIWKISANRSRMAELRMLRELFERNIETPLARCRNAKRVRKEREYEHLEEFDVEDMQLEITTTWLSHEWTSRYWVVRGDPGDWWMKEMDRDHDGGPPIGAADHWCPASPDQSGWLDRLHSEFCDVMRAYPGPTPDTTALEFQRRGGTFSGSVWTPPQHSTPDAVRSSWERTERLKLSHFGIQER